MSSQIILEDTNDSGRHVTLLLDEDCYLWVDQSRVQELKRVNGEVILSLDERPGRVCVDANAFLDFVGRRPVRTE